MVEHANRYLASGGTDGHMYGAILAQPAIVKEAGERSPAVEKGPAMTAWLRARR